MVADYCPVTRTVATLFLVPEDRFRPSWRCQRRGLLQGIIKWNNRLHHCRPPGKHGQPLIGRAHELVAFCHYIHPSGSEFELRNRELKCTVITRTGDQNGQSSETRQSRREESQSRRSARKSLLSTPEK